ALAERDPWLVGFTCYLWNIERTLWVARELKRRRPGVRVVLGGPEITPDNAWVIDTPDYDFAVIGEGEQTFAQLLLGLLDGAGPGPFTPRGPPGGGAPPPPAGPPSARRCPTSPNSARLTWPASSTPPTRKCSCWRRPAAASSSASSATTPRATTSSTTCPAS